MTINDGGEQQNHGSTDQNQPKEEKEEQEQQQQQQQQYDGIWIGIDLGTSNSSCAVWDSSRGGAKWVRLPGVTELTGTKAGRIMPSVVRFIDGDGDDDEDPLVGFPALLASPESNNKNNSNSNISSSSSSSSSSILRSVKRLLGKRYEDLDPSWIKTLDFDVRRPSSQSDGDNDDGDVRLVARTNNYSTTKTVTMTPQQVLAIELKAIKKACQSYLDRYRVSKNLRVPGGGDEKENDGCLPVVDNVVVGVPAHFSQRHIGLVKEACRKAGFHGYVGTCLESTAAAIAYGLTLQERSKQRLSESTAEQQQKQPTTKGGGPTIMVVDMGGGTTDITVASSKKNDHSSSFTSEASEDGGNDGDGDGDLSSSYRVLVTQGDERLGGDDIDQAIMEYCQRQVSQQRLQDQSSREIKKNKIESLKSACRKAKESLCRIEDPSPSETILVNFRGDDNRTETESRKVLITQQIFETIILEPWLRRARDLILKTHDNFYEATATAGITIDEVVLVGGTTRIPAIRRMIQDIFPGIELSSSLNPMSSVAQGLAIQAAILSKKIPLHELKSAMMLDCIPHAIGVQLGAADDRQHNGGFVEIIPRNTLLPAVGSATFVLANKYQAGVTIRAVEVVGADTYEPIGKEDFSFVLRRLSKAQFENISERSIQVGMKLDTDGKFIVSVFDENDPEQVRKRDRFEKIKNGQEVLGELDYIKDMMVAESDGISNEQIRLIVALITLFVLYVAVKIAFTDPEEDGGSILA